MKIYPVIHILHPDLTRSEIEHCKLAGADGVFLISHRGDSVGVLESAIEAKSKYDESFKIGINLLGYDALDAVEEAVSAKLDMLWADYIGVDSGGVNTTGCMCSKYFDRIQIFASVAFKYQPIELKPEIAAKNALAAGFVPTTSGSGTGHAPEVSKIQLMSKAVNGNLAVASGMTPENVADYAKYLSYILVSTGVSKDENHLDFFKLKALIENAKNSA
jgi:predicted TIM-barrel enzyme